MFFLCQLKMMNFVKGYVFPNLIALFLIINNQCVLSLLIKNICIAGRKEAIKVLEKKIR